MSRERKRETFDAIEFTDLSAASKKVLFEQAKEIAEFLRQTVLFLQNTYGKFIENLEERVDAMPDDVDGIPVEADEFAVAISTSLFGFHENLDTLFAKNIAESEAFYEKMMSHVHDESYLTVVENLLPEKIAAPVTVSLYEVAQILLKRWVACLEKFQAYRKKAQSLGVSTEAMNNIFAEACISDRPRLETKVEKIILGQAEAPDVADTKEEEAFLNTAQQLRNLVATEPLSTNIFKNKAAFFQGVAKFEIIKYQITLWANQGFGEDLARVLGSPNLSSLKPQEAVQELLSYRLSNILASSISSTTCWPVDAGADTPHRMVLNRLAALNPADTTNIEVIKKILAEAACAPNISTNDTIQADFAKIARFIEGFILPNFSDIKKYPKFLALQKDLQDNKLLPAVTPAPEM